MHTLRRKCTDIQKMAELKVTRRVSFNGVALGLLRLAFLFTCEGLFLSAPGGFGLEDDRRCKVDR